MELICTKCKIEKPVEEFYRKKGRKTGRRSECKSCQTIYNDAWRKDNVEKYRESNKAWQKANPEKYKQIVAAWAKANPEKTRASNEAWRKANPERRKEIERASKKKNEKKVKNTARTYREQPKNKRSRRDTDLKRKYGIDHQEFDRMVVEQNGTCACCGGPPSKNKGGSFVLHVDHDHETGNVRDLLCGPCNKALGLLRDSSKMANLAYIYLKKHGK